MKQNSLLFFCLLLLSMFTYAQDDKTQTLTPEQTKDLMGKIKFDTTKFLSGISTSACMCIDSIDGSGKSHQEIVEEINNCIDKQALTYQLLLKTTATFGNEPGKNIISVASDKASNEYKKYYYDIERWLKDSCAAMNSKIVLNNKESEFSMSKNPAAALEYDKGIDFINVDNYKDALPHFKRSVELDPKFAFAWDNLGMCYRQTEKYDDAINAYKKSLEIDPKGTMPLHNLPVAYEFKKDYKQALIEYQKITIIYPDDPEIFYGIGRIYTYYIIDYPKALESACKAYNLYVEQRSPYRTDAEKQISYIYSKMKEAGKEKEFTEILKKNNIKSN